VTKLLPVPLEPLVEVDHFPHAEPGAGHFRHASGRLVSEVDTGALARPHRLLEQVLGDLGEGPPRALREPLDLDAQARSEA
jgi:hypothetical protein